MKEDLSLSEIMEQFDSKWVLIGDPETDEGFNIKHGVVFMAQ